MANLMESQAKTTVELVEISEQLEPLMQKKSQPEQLENNDNGSFDTLLTGPSQNPTPLPLSDCDRLGNEYVPLVPAGEVLASCGASKSRKRPGSVRDSQYVTMTGTVKTGNSVGQPVEVQLELTENEYLRLTSREPPTPRDENHKCGRSQGPHVVLWTLFCIPVAMMVSACVSFYNGAMTWYNMITYFSEEKSFLHKLTICPLLILSFPVTVGVSALVVALVASVMQVSWSWLWWWEEICDGEKGFYGWFCGKVGLPRCSPYQVVVLDDASTQSVLP